MTPQIIDDEVLSFAESVVPGGRPVYLPVKPAPFARLFECFDTVDEQVRRGGGSRQLGWQIWRGRLLIEAEFHAVWRSPDGQLHDITPKPGGIKSIMFLPDPTATYKGAQVDNVRLNLSGSPLVNDFILAKETLFKIQNKGERAFLKEFQVSDRESKDSAILNGILLLTELMANADMSVDSPCLCRSGMTYRACHAPELDAIRVRY